MDKKTIWIIDDNKMVIHAPHVLLGEDRYKVYGADNGEVGIRGRRLSRPLTIRTLFKSYWLCLLGPRMRR